MVRSLTSVARNPNFINIIDVPGMRVDDITPASFDDLCYNYVHERLQLLFHERTFSEQLERYSQV